VSTGGSSAEGDAGSWSKYLDHRPIVVALAGPNGAGKSTFFEAHLKSSGLRFLNADVLAKELEVDAYDAARMVAALGVVRLCTPRRVSRGWNRFRRSFSARLPAGLRPEPFTFRQFLEPNYFSHRHD